MKFRDPTLIAGPRETLVAIVGDPVWYSTIPNWLRLAAIRKLAIPRTHHSGSAVLSWIRQCYPPAGSTTPVHASSTARRRS